MLNEHENDAVELDFDAGEEMASIALASESSLAKDWLSAAEDDAWAGL